MLFSHISVCCSLFPSILSNIFAAFGFYSPASARTVSLYPVPLPLFPWCTASAKTKERSPRLRLQSRRRFSRPQTGVSQNTDIYASFTYCLPGSFNFIFPQFSSKFEYMTQVDDKSSDLDFRLSLHPSVRMALVCSILQTQNIRDFQHCFCDLDFNS